MGGRCESGSGGGIIGAIMENPIGPDTATPAKPPYAEKYVPFAKWVAETQSPDLAVPTWTGAPMPREGDTIFYGGMPTPKRPSILRRLWRFVCDVATARHFRTIR